jgi:hypothetical protein
LDQQIPQHRVALFADPTQSLPTCATVLERIQPLVLLAFFIVQHGVLIAGKVTGSVIDWSPEKPRTFGMRPVNGDWNGAAHERHS